MAHTYADRAIHYWTQAMVARATSDGDDAATHLEALAVRALDNHCQFALYGRLHDVEPLDADAPASNDKLCGSGHYDQHVSVNNGRQPVSVSMAL